MRERRAGIRAGRHPLDGLPEDSLVQGQMLEIRHQAQVLLAGDQTVDGGELPRDADRGAHRLRVGGRIVAADAQLTGVGADQSGEDPDAWTSSARTWPGPPGRPGRSLPAGRIRHRAARLGLRRTATSRLAAGPAAAGAVRRWDRYRIAGGLPSVGGLLAGSTQNSCSSEDEPVPARRRWGGRSRCCCAPRQSLTRPSTVTSWARCVLRRTGTRTGRRPPRATRRRVGELHPATRPLSETNLTSTGISTEPGAVRERIREHRVRPGRSDGPVREHRSPPPSQLVQSTAGAARRNSV